MVVPTDPRTRLFQPFIRFCIEERTKHKKENRKFEQQFWKEVGNSTYGKTAQGLTQKRVYDLRDDAMVQLPPSRVTQPFFASFITSFTRAVLGEILNRFSTDVEVFSVTTDGFLSNANDNDIEAATRGQLFQLFAEARRELSPMDTALEIKHEVVRPLGWRTRGSATLEPGEGCNGYVLQKGGLKNGPGFRYQTGERSHS